MRRSTGMTLAMLGGAAALTAGARALLLVVRVSGVSMVPTFQPGDAVLVLRRFARPAVRAGDIVVCRPPDGVRHRASLLIKRVTAVAGDPLPGPVSLGTASAGSASRSDAAVPAGRVFVRGDGEHSFDSRAFGAIPLDHVVGHVVARLAS